MSMRPNNLPRSGQALLLVVVMMGGVLFLVTAVAGLLMYYQVQQSNDVANSTVAIFAADAALERGLYYYLHEFTPSEACLANGCTLTTPEHIPALVFQNFAQASTTIVVPAAARLTDPVRLYGSGRDPGGRTIRTLETNLIGNP